MSEPAHGTIFNGSRLREYDHLDVSRERVAETSQTKTIGQIRNFYLENFHQNIQLRDGADALADNVEIRTLDHFMSDLIVLWVVSESGIPMLQQTSAGRQNIVASKHETGSKR